MDSASTPQGPASHPGAEHLLIFPDRGVADQVAEELAGDGFAHVRVVQQTEQTTDGAGPGWAVHVLDTRLPDTRGGAAYEALRERFASAAAAHDGWYDEPGDPRPPVADGDEATQ